MNELSVISTVSDVIRTSKDLYKEFSKYNMVSAARKKALKDSLDTYVKVRMANNKAIIFDNNMEILQRSYRTIEQLPPNTPLYKEAMKHFEMLSDDLGRLLRSY